MANSSSSRVSFVTTRAQVRHPPALPIFCRPLTSALRSLPQRLTVPSLALAPRPPPAPRRRSPRPSPSAGRIKAIYLGHNDIGDGGASALAEAIADGAAPKLQTVYLEANPRITARGAELLHNAVDARSVGRYAEWRELAWPWAVKGGWTKPHPSRGGERGGSGKASALHAENRLKFEGCVARGVSGRGCRLDSVAPEEVGKWRRIAQSLAMVGGWDRGGTARGAEGTRAKFEAAVARAVMSTERPPPPPLYVTIVGLKGDAPPLPPPPVAASPPRSKVASPRKAHSSPRSPADEPPVVHYPSLVPVVQRGQGQPFTAAMREPKPLKKRPSVSWAISMG